jgi:hypothetical protein
MRAEIFEDFYHPSSVCSFNTLCIMSILYITYKIPLSSAKSIELLILQGHWCSLKRHQATIRKGAQIDSADIYGRTPPLVYAVGHPGTSRTHRGRRQAWSLDRFLQPKICTYCRPYVRIWFNTLYHLIQIE